MSLRPPSALLAALLACAILPVSARAAQVYLSTAGNATIGGLTFRSGDIARYDTVTGVATLYLSEDNFSANENIDSLYIQPNGNILLSTVNGATLGGLTFRDGDIVQYNPLTNSATLFFSENLFSNNVNIDGFSVLANGHYIISTTGNATLGGLTFRDGDLAEYNPVTGTASLFFSENLFSANEDIDAVHVLSDGSILLSTRNGASIGGITFLDGDVVRYVPSTNTASILLPESTFTGNVNVDGVFYAAPEPDTGLLLALGLAGLTLRRARQT
ncbi:MAG TPA: PEP-CTERM sorting domain-containing protein [Myxococcota bacterium]|nr:PEP-CTERM sorting domain-containing protein [Myxococcota bacterium]